MPKIITVLFIMIISVSLCYADSHFFTAGIAYPITTNRSKSDSVNINISLIQNSLGEINGANFCGFSAISKASLNGYQSALFYSQIDHDQKGMSISSVNLVNRSVYGVQMGFSNITGGDLYGVQAGTSVNFLIGDLKGLQLSSLFSIVGNNTNGLQLSGACNITGTNCKGIQMSSFFNFTGKEKTGLQWSSVNIAGRQRGLQLGYLNIAQFNEGWQIGLVNIGESQKGIPLGLINISDDGNIAWHNYFSNFAQFITGARFETAGFYSSLELGGSCKEFKNTDNVMTGFHYGYSLTKNKLSLDTDFGYFLIFHVLDADEEVIENSGAFQLRISTSYKLNEWLDVFAGTGISTYNTYTEKENFKNKALFFAGINLF